MCVIRALLLCVLVASVADASEPEKNVVRALMLSERPDDDTHRVHVKGQVVTTLRFEKAVDPGKTKLLGWEGRLEPLAVVRNKVILEPLHDLNDEEGIPLVVTLVDGTEVMFLLRPPGWEQQDQPDQQVDVFKDREGYAAMHAALRRALQENGTLAEENQRYREEATSEDHALAALLAAGAVAQTPFMIASRINGEDGDTRLKATLFRGKGKAAVVVTLKNLSQKQAWSMKSARLLSVSSGRESTVAVRSTRPSIAPGESGVVAFVADRSAFLENGKSTSVFLEFYRQDGLRQAVVQLDPELVAE
ncbi:DUF2381 family protein [Corallococcus sp. CA053C]|nr:DUF2381 family protein [Corallococcus sp. CA053C]